MKSGKLNEKGYLLLESMTALFIVSLVMLVYSPFINSMLQKLETEKMEVEMHRLLLESARKEEGAAVVERNTGQWRFEVTARLNTTKKGITVKNAKADRQTSIQITSVQWSE